MQRVYLCALSDPIVDRSRYEKLIPVFEKQGIQLELSKYLQQDLPACYKAQDLNRALRSGRYTWILDVSGGNLANLVLPYLDYEAYQNGTTYYGAFSDGTCIVNALACRGHKKALLFPIWNQTDFSQTISLIQTGKMHPQIESMGHARPMPRHAKVFGGNIRCFLKLAGTDGFPDLTDSYLLLESSSADWNAFRSMSAHLAQIGAFDSIWGIVLGRFNALERQAGSRDRALEVMMAFLNSLVDQPFDFYQADQLGHIPNSQGIWISAGKTASQSRELSCKKSVEKDENPSGQTAKTGPVKAPIGSLPSVPKNEYQIKSNLEVDKMTNNDRKESKNQAHSYTISSADVYITPFSFQK